MVTLIELLDPERRHHASEHVSIYLPTEAVFNPTILEPSSMQHRIVSVITNCMSFIFLRNYFV